MLLTWGFQFLKTLSVQPYLQLILNPSKKITIEG